MIEVSDLEDRHRKAVSRAAKAKSAHENAQIELERIETALEVVREMTGPSSGAVSSGGDLTKKQQVVINSLKIGQNNAMSPVNIFRVASNDTSFDGDVNYVRTTLWRMAGKGAIGGANGVYWRFEEETQSVTSEPIASASVAPAEMSGRHRIPSTVESDTWDDDSAVPF